MNLPPLCPPIPEWGFCPLKILDTPRVIVTRNYLDDPYVQQDGCVRAARQLCARLAAARGRATQDAPRGDCERIADHLDEQSGWLSIDVINVLCAANLAMKVEAAPFPVHALAQESEVAFLVNCKQRHWTVLRQQAAEGPWKHINSIGGDGRLWHGRKDVESRERLQALFEGLRVAYGGFSLHLIRRGGRCVGLDSWRRRACERLCRAK